MISSFLIAFRETLEAALIVGIILSYLYRTKQQRYNKTIYLAIALGILASILGAVIFNMALGGFEGRAEQIFEGITMLVGSLMITTAIIWMIKHRHPAKKIESDLSEQLVKGGTWGIFLLVFLSILREGIETVIFLQSATLASNENNAIGILLGILIASGIGYLIFVESKKINIKTFFNITSVLLILFAAGLFARATGEFEEAGLASPIIEHIWDLNPPQAPDGTYPLLHEEGHIGAFFHDLFGYTASPSLLFVISYVAYLAGSVLLWKNIKGQS